MPLRSFGGASWASLPNEVGNQPSRLLGTASWYDVPFAQLGVEIDAAAEGGVVAVYVPTQWKRVGRIRISLVPLVTATMNLTYTITQFPRCSGGVNGWTTDAQIVGAVDEIQCLTESLAPYLTVMPGDFIAVSVVYRGAGGGGIASDLVFLGIVVTED